MRPFREWCVVGCLPLGGLLASAAPELANRRIVLPPPDLRVGATFTEVTGVRELHDGRLLIVDHGRSQVVVTDSGSTRTLPVGSQGKGPGQYRRPRDLFTLRGDSTLLIDVDTRRWHVLAGASIVSTVVPSRVGIRQVGARVWGADHGSGVLGYGRYAASNSPHAGRSTSETFGYADSIAVLLGSRSGDRVDTIARIASGRPGVRLTTRSASPTATPLTYFLVSPLAVDEQGLLFADGWVALVRSSPYRVDWLTPTRRLIRGVPLPFARTLVDEHEKRAAIDRAWPSPPYTGPKWNPEDFPEWPGYLPPFTDRALLAAPGGRVVIRRMPSAAAPSERFDVVDRRGMLVGFVELPLGQRLVSFGQRHVYVATRTPSGETLARHAWPAL